MPPSDYDASPNVSPTSPAVLISEIFLTLRRGWRLPVIGCSIGLAAGLAYVLMVSSPYKSTAQILIDRSVNRFFQAQKVLDEPAFDDSEIGNQVYVLSSESIVLPVIQALDLIHDPEFAGKVRGGEDQSSWSISKLLGLGGVEAQPPVDPKEALERIVMEKFLTQLSIEREGSGVIDVTFASKDSKKAARIANAVVDAYLAATSQAKANSTKLASQLLQERLIEVKQSLLAANRTLEEFKAANNLVDRGTGITPIEQLTALTARLADAKMRVTDAKARVEQIERASSSDDSLGASFPDSQVITQVRGKYLDLSTKAAELASRVGADHDAVVKIRHEMDEARSAIREEEQRLLTFYLSAYQAAKSQGEELAGMIAKLSEEAKSESKADVTLRQLQGTADSLRDTYNGLLEKFNALNVQPLNPIQDARVITRAAPQLHKSSKKAIALLGGSVVFGLLLGAGGAFARELVASVFRRPEQVKQVTGIYCVSVPAIEASATETTSPETDPDPKHLVHHVLDSPHSQFTEAFRTIKALVDAEKRVSDDKVIGIVSPLARCGKSTTVTSLATLLAGSGRTLVIDGDLHKRQLTARLAPFAREGLVEALKDLSRLGDLVLKVPRLGVDFLPVFLSQRDPNAAELLGSPQMAQLLTLARNEYDYIVIECAPILSVVDVKIIERFIDKFVLVIEWGKTKKVVVQEALEELDDARDRVLCVVLNKADPAALSILNAYKGPEYGAYYSA